jgi:hypothetical protein
MGWVVSVTPRPRFTSGKGTPVPIAQEAGWAPEPVWTQRLEEKFFRLCRGSNLDRQVVQTIARHYTDWATRLTLIHYCFIKKIKPDNSVSVQRIILKGTLSQCFLSCGCSRCRIHRQHTYNMKSSNIHRKIETLDIGFRLLATLKEALWGRKFTTARMAWDNRKYFILMKLGYGPLDQTNWKVEKLL